jgi:hypothetical protein
MPSDSGENLPPTWAESIILRSRLLHFLGGDLRLVENAMSSNTVSVAYHSRNMSLEELECARIAITRLRYTCSLQGHSPLVTGGRPQSTWVYCTHCLTCYSPVVASRRFPQHYRYVVRSYYQQTCRFPLVYRN